MTNSTTKNIVMKCKKSASFFIENFCKIKHPSKGIIPFKLFKYQKSAIGNFRTKRFNIFRKCRQSGISTLTGNYALWLAMFYSHKTILIVSKRDEDAKQFLNDNIKLVYDNLPDWMRAIWKPIAWNEHQVGFANGSLIRSLTSSPDTLRSNASSLNIIDEAAFMPEMETMWSGAWSCVSTDTLVCADNGIVEIGTLGNLAGEQWQDIDIEIQSDTGPQHSDKFYINGNADINIIRTSLGYTIGCTDNHRLKDHNYEWIDSKNITLGSRLALKCSHHRSNHITYLNDIAVIDRPMIDGYKNNDVISPLCHRCGRQSSIQYRQYKRNYKRNGGYICPSCAVLSMSPDFKKPVILDEDLAELIGYYVGDGDISTTRPKRFNLSYDPQDQDIFTHFSKYLESLGLIPHHRVGEADTLQVDNAKWVEWLGINGFISKSGPYDAKVPEIILKSNSKIQAAFLRGLFEADGWNYQCRNGNRPNSPRNKLGLSSTSVKLLSQVQVMLLNLGVIAKRSESRGGFEGSGLCGRLDIINIDNIINYMKEIGFISKRKQILISKRTAKRPEKFTIDPQGIFYDEVVSISRDHLLTVDISVPGNNTYIANGFVSHNTLQHGGSVIVVSTTNGVGNWYWDKWTEAEEDSGIFNPIHIRWWDMDWVIEYTDEVSGKPMRIAPTDGIRECTTKEEIEKWGKYWSPWLQEQYEGLKARGEAHKFRQEVLGEFIGGGSTVLDVATLHHIGNMVKESPSPQIVEEPIPWMDQTTGLTELIDFSGSESNEGLWIWDQPYLGTSIRYKNGAIVDPGIPGHTYVIGADVATGGNNDCSTAEVFDLTTMRQVAELMGHYQFNTFAKMLDWLGRWYNNALLIVERTGVGAAVIQDLQAMVYPNLWREKRPSKTGVHYSPYGFATTEQSKPRLNKALTQSISDTDGEGFTIVSPRLYKQLLIYIRMRNRQGIETKRTGAQAGRGNYDDLVIASALALIAMPDAVDLDPTGLIPTRSQQVPQPQLGQIPVNRAAEQQQAMNTRDPNILIPLSYNSMHASSATPEEQLAAFANSLLSTKQQTVPTVTRRRRHTY